ncbi:DUF5011 domain-containing protein [Candidatus Kaiserbacteria bacterium]|nr:DUF5011 domain-containing protein [Candidatus Kaiserbacteria bacterium]
MGDTIQRNDYQIKYISSKDAAALFGVTNDHISRLCRQKKIRGVVQDGLWLVDKESVSDFFAAKGVSPRPVSVREVIHRVAKYISSKDAAALFGVTNDHISRLCRQKKIRGVVQDGLWLVDKESVSDFFAAKGVSPRPVSVYEILQFNPQALGITERILSPVQEKLVKESPLVAGEETKTLASRAPRSVSDPAAYSMSSMRSLVSLKGVFATVAIVFVFMAFIGSSQNAITRHASLTNNTSPSRVQNVAAIEESIPSHVVSSIGGFFANILRVFGWDVGQQGSVYVHITPTAKSALSSPPATVASGGFASFGGGVMAPSSVVNNTYNNTYNTTNNETHNVYNNTAYSLPATSGITTNDLDRRLQQFAQSLQVSQFTPVAPPASGGVANQIALTQHIDSLNGTLLTNVHVNGVTGLTSADLPDLSGQYLAVSGGTLTGLLKSTYSGTSTFSGGLGAGVLSISSTTATSTFANGIALSGGCFSVNGNCITTGGGGGTPGGSSGQIQFNNGGVFDGVSNFSYNASSGNLGIGTTTPTARLAIVASSTDTTSTLFSLASSTGATVFSVSNIGGITFVSATGQSATTTSFFSTISSSTHLFSTDAILGTATITSATTTSLFASLFNAATGTITNLTTTSATATNFFATTASSTNLYATAANIGGLSVNSLSIGSLNGLLKATAGVISTGFVNLASDVTNVLSIANGGTGTSSAPTYGKLLMGNSGGTFDYVSTTSLGINSAIWGSITGTLSNQTDLQSALDAKLSLLSWYATTTDGLAQGSTNKYYSDTLVNTYLNTLNKGYFFSTTSSDYWKTANNFFSTTSTAYWETTQTRWATTSASYFLSQNQGLAFSTTSTDYWKTQQTFTGASTTLLSDANTWSGTNVFSGNATLTRATTTAFAITSLTNSILSTNANGSVVASTTIGWNLLKGPASSIFAFDSSGNPTATTTIGTNYLIGPANAILSTNASGAVVATTSIGTNYLTGILGIANGGTGQSTFTSSQLLYGNGTNGLTSVATSSVSAGTGVTFTGTAGFLVGGSALTINTPWTLGASNAIYSNNSGNVGIGTTTPQTKLEVSDNTSASTTPFSLSNFGSATSSTKVSLAFKTDDIVHNTGTTTASIFSIFQGGTGGVPQTGNGDLAFATLRSGTLTEGARLTSAGSFGIATTAPSATFAVSGNVFIWGNATTTNTFATTASSTNLFSQLASLGTLNLNATTSKLLATDVNGMVIATTTIGVNYLSGILPIANGGTATGTQVTNGVNFFDGTRITSGTALTFNGTTFGAPLFNSTQTSGTSTIASGQGFTIGGTQLVVQQGSGRVGIGTNAPSYTLDVSGTGRFTSTLALGSVTTCTGGQALQTDGSGNISCGTISVGGASTGGGWTTNSIGRVTLATTTDLAVVGASTTPYAKFSILSGSAATTTLVLSAAASQSANLIDIYDANGVLSTVLTADGKLGLGNSAPTDKLNVQGAVSAQYFNATSSTASTFTGGLIAQASSTFSALLNLSQSTTSLATFTNNTWFTGIAASSLLALDANQKLVATTSIGWNLLKGPASSIFAFDSSGNPTATTSIGVNYLSGILGIANGGTNASSIGSHMLTAFDGTRIVSTSTPTAAAYLATSSTANSIFAGKLGVGSLTAPTYTLDVNGFVNTDGTTGGYKQAGNTVLYASTTNTSLAVGASAAAAWMSASSTSWNDIAIGSGALATIPTDHLGSNGQLNTSIGIQSLSANTIGYGNTAIGYYALTSNTTGVVNTAIGTNALNKNIGSYNTANGSNALFNNTTGSNNSANGYYALFYNGSATSTTAFGAYAGQGNGNYSNQGGTVVGMQAGFNFATGSDYNTLLGYQSGYGITTGARNVLLGQSTIAASQNQVTTGSNNIAIGNDVAIASSTLSNQLVIGNLIYGTGLSGTGATISTGNIAIGTSTPYSKLTTWGTANLFEAVNNSSSTVFLIGQNGATSTNFAATTICFTGDTCRTTWPSSGTSWPWTIATTFGTSTNATTTPTWYQMGFYASSTSQLASANIWNTLALKATTSKLLATDANGMVIATTSIGVNYLSGILPIANGGTATGTQVTNGVNFFDGTRITSGTALTFDGTNLGINDTTPSYSLDVNGFINTDGTTGGYKQAGNTVLYASTTNTSLAVGASAAAAWMSASSTSWLSVAIGQGALGTTPTSGTAIANTAVGYNALSSNTTGQINTATGYLALFSNTTGTNNTASGNSTLQSNTTGGSNTALGARSLIFNTTGSSNTASGYNALLSNTTGSSNVAVGSSASNFNQSATSTVAIGSSAAIGTANYSNQGGTVIGFSAGRGFTTGSDYNTLLGYQSGYAITTGARNVLLGQSTITASRDQVTTGSNNIAIGNDVAVPSATASNQLVIGNLIYGTGLSGTGATISTGNIAIGTSTPYSKLTTWGTGSLFEAVTNSSSTVFSIGQNGATTTNFAITNLASAILSTNANGSVVATSSIGVNYLSGILPIANGGTATGTQVTNGVNFFDGTRITSGTALTFNGTTFGAPLFNSTQTSGTSTIAAGQGFTIGTSQFVLQQGSGNVGIGTSTPGSLLSVAGDVYASGFYNTSGTTGGYKIDGNLILQASSTLNSFFIGQSAGNTSTTGLQNYGLGTFALSAITTGDFNNAMGRAAMNALTTGSSNTAMGNESLRLNTTGSDNVAIGANASRLNISATSSVAIGSSAGNAAANFNNQGGTYVGYLAGYGAQTNSDFNTLFGYQSGRGITTGSNNIWIGTATSSAAIANLTTGSQNILIGNNISFPSATASGQLNIGNIIYGTGITGTGSTVSSGNIGIGTTTPYSKLTTWGTANLFEAVNNSSSTVFLIGQNGATSTNLFSTTASSTNLFSQTASLGILNLRATTSKLLATDANGMVIATTSIGVNYLTGILPIANGGTNNSTGGTTNGVMYFDGTKFTSDGGLTYTPSSSFFVNDLATFASGFTSQGLSTFDGNIVANASSTFSAPLNIAQSSTTLATFSGSTWLTNLTASTLLALDANKKIVSTTTIGWNLLKGPASSIFAFDSSGNPTATSTIGLNYLKGGNNLLLSTDSSGNVVGTTSVGVNYLSGILPIANGGTATGTQVTNGVNFFDGTRITSGTAITWNGTTFAASNISTGGTLGVTGLSTLGGFISTASSTITSGLFSANGGASTTNFTATGLVILGNATTTNLFSTTASSTNLFSQLASLGTLNLKATTSKLLATDANGMVIATTSIGVNYLSGILPIANGGTATGTQVTNGVNFFDGTRITSGTALTFDGTNLGVGTTSPQERLTVMGGNIFQTGGSGNSGQLYNPALLGGVDLGIGVGESLFGGQDMTVVGNTLYLVTASTTANTGCSTSDMSDCELRIFDIATGTPRFLGGADFGPTATAHGNGIAVAGQYAYVTVSTVAGTCNSTTATGCEFRIYDISNPSAPLFKGGLNFAISGINVVVSGHYAYVTLNSVSGNDFRIIDISDPTNPVTVGGLDLGTAGIGLRVQGNYAYIAQGSVTGNDFIIVDISNPAAPVTVGGMDLGTNGRAIAVSGNYAYVGKDTGGVTGNLIIYDVSNPTAIATTSVISAAAAQTVQVSGRYMYLGVSSLAGSCNSTTITGCDFRVYDISDPYNPIAVGGVDENANVQGLVVSGHSAFVGLSSISGNDLVVHDITGADLQSLAVGTLDAGSLQLRNDLTSQGHIFADTFNAGAGGIYSTGGIFSYVASSSATTPIAGLFMGGNVGVGTTTPWGSLSLAGTAGQTNPLFVIASSTGTSLFSIAGDTGLATLSGGFLSTASSTITSGLFSMNGGASTTNFTATGLTILGNATTTNLFSTTASSTNLFAQTASLGILNIPSITNAILSTNSSGQVVATTSIGTNYLTGVLAIANGGTNNSSAYTAGSVIFSNGTSLTQDNSNFFWDDTNNRFGIGTTSPNSAIEISGSDAGTTLNTFTSGTTLSISNRNTTANNFSTLAFRTQDLTNGGATSSAQIVGINTAHTAGASSGALAFLTLNAGSLGEAMRILPTNLVGIGITAPTSMLHVSGTQPTSASSGNGTAATSILNIAGITGGVTTDTGTRTGGAGSALTLTLGTGGTATAADVLSTGGTGGTFTMTGGVGGAASVAGTGNNTGGAGSAFTWTGGIGGAANGDTTGNNTGGTGGAFTWVAGTGGAATNANGTPGTRTGGVGGAITLRAGAGGVGTDTGGNGGGLSLSSGLAAAATSSAGGAVTITGAAGGTTGSGGAGGAITLTGGLAGGDNSVARAGGAIAITAGASKGNNAGGAITLTAGASSASSTLAGGAISLTGGLGGTNTNTGTALGGTGSGFAFTLGTGGTATAADVLSTGGTGGTFTMTGGVGGAASVAGTGNNTGGAGSPFTWTGGTGGAANGNTTGNNTGGIGGAFTWTAGTGGAATNANGTPGTRTGGAGGAVTINAGAGGAGTDTGGSGGLLTISGGTAAAATSSAGGGVSILGDVGTSIGSGGAGGALTLTAGAAAGDNSVARAGGAVTVTAGASKGQNAGGAITLTTGAASASSTLAGGLLTLTTGAGGTNTNTGTATGGAGGGHTFSMGAGGTATAADVLSTGGAGGTFTMTGGVGGAASVAGTGNNTGGAGSAFTWTAGTGGAASGNTTGVNTAGAGGAVALSAGTGGAATNANATPGTRTGGAGGALTLNAGIGGTGTDVAGVGGAMIFKTAQTTSLTEQMRITNTGLVGIGTTTPFWKLTVASSTGPQIALTDGTASSNAWTFRSISNSFYIATSTATATSTVAALAINSNGAATFGNNLTVNGTASLQQATTTTFAITSITNSILSTNANGSVVASTTIGWNLLKGPASSIFAFDASGNPIATTTIGTNYLIGPANAILSTNASGAVVATTSIGVNYLTGILGIANGGTATGTQVTNGVNFFDGTRITSGTALTFTGTNLGIGTTTPMGLLTIATSSATAANAAMKIQSNSGTTTVTFFTSTTTFLTTSGVAATAAQASNYMIIGNGSTAASVSIVNGGLCVDSDGWCFASTTGRVSSVTSTTGGSDVAEMYASHDTLVPGNIVATAGNVAIKAAVTDTKHHIIGIVSTAPGLTLGFNPDGTFDTTDNHYPVALVGRVPVLVNLDNGPIAIGDRIALSTSTPGVGMKADPMDPSVAIALQAYQTGATSTAILAFVNLQDINVSAIQAIASSTFATSSQTAIIDGPFAGVSQMLHDTLSLALASVSGIAGTGVRELGGAVHGSLAAFDKVFAKEIYADNITAQKVTAVQQMCVGTTCVTEAQLQALLASAAVASGGGGSGAAGATGGSTGGVSSGATTPTATTATGSVAPIISVNGNNPASIQVGSVYSDLGATITGPTSALNLGISAIVDGGATTTIDQIHIDTSVTGTHTIRYFATDASGVQGSATRTVVVYDPTTTTSPAEETASGTTTINTTTSSTDTSTSTPSTIDTSTSSSTAPVDSTTTSTSQ